MVDLNHFRDDHLGGLFSPQCSVFGVGEVGVRTVEYLRDHRLGAYQYLHISQDDQNVFTGSPLDAIQGEAMVPPRDSFDLLVLHFFTRRQELDIAGDVLVLILLSDDSLASLREVRDLVRQARMEKPDILVLVGVLVRHPMGEADERSGLVAEFAGKRVNVIFVAPHDQRPDSHVLGQIVVMVANPMVTPGLICIDWADLSDFMERGGIGFLGFGAALWTGGEAGDMSMRYRSAGDVLRATSEAAMKTASHLALQHAGRLFADGGRESDRWMLVQIADDIGLNEINVCSDIVFGEGIGEGHCCPMCSLRAAGEAERTALTAGGFFLMDSGKMVEVGDNVEVSVIVR